MYLTRYTDPEAVGYLVAEYIRCGKPGCSCAAGRRHGPYWYLVYRCLEGGAWRQRKRYVPPGLEPAVRQHLEEAKARDRSTIALLTQSKQLRVAVRKGLSPGSPQGASKDAHNGNQRTAFDETRL